MSEAWESLPLPEQLDVLADGLLEDERRTIASAITRRAAAYIRHLDKALKEITLVDYETYEALQSTCIDIAREALEGEKGAPE